MNNFADVSVIIPCYNCEKTIIRALDSILNQTLIPKEVILVDDKSKDNTINVIEVFIENNKNKTNIKFIKLVKNAGPSKARNTGWDNSTCKYIAFLDSDDSWHYQKIEIQYNFMEQNPDVYLCSNKYRVIENKINEKEESFNDSFEIITKFKCLIKNYFTTPTVMLKREFDFRFDENKRYSEDYKLWLEIIFNGYKAVQLNTTLTYLYKSEFGSAGLSSNIFNMYYSGLDNFRYLYKKKLINLFLYLFSVGFRTLKFIRILIKTIYLRFFK